MNRNTLLAVLLTTVAIPTFAADNPWIGKIVRVGYSGQLVTGKVIHSMDCLYVKFDQVQPGGVMMARVADSIDSLQLKRGNSWVPADLNAIRKVEAAKCFAEANG